MDLVHESTHEIADSVTKGRIRIWRVMEGTTITTGVATAVVVAVALTVTITGMVPIVHDSDEIREKYKRCIADDDDDDGCG